MLQLLIPAQKGPPHATVYFFSDFTISLPLILRRKIRDSAIFFMTEERSYSIAYSILIPRFSISSRNKSAGTSNS